MIHIEFLRGFFDSIWGFVQAVCAVTIVIYTIKLFHVTDAQRQISQQQQLLMEKQNDLAMDMERGVLTSVECELSADKKYMFLRFKNTGRSHLTFGDAQVIAWDTNPPTFQKGWQAPIPVVSFTKSVEPGEKTEAMAFAVPFECYLPNGEQKPFYAVTFRIQYKTLGIDRVCRFGWAFHQEQGAPLDHRVARHHYGRGYEYDALLDKEPDAYNN